MNSYIHSKGKIIIWVVVLLLLAGAVAGGFYLKEHYLKPAPLPSPSPTPRYDSRILTVGVDSRPTAMLFYAVNHFIPGHKFSVVPVVLEDPNERWSRMSAGALDLSSATFPEFVLGAARHKPGKMLMFTSSSRGCDGISVNSGINGIEDLMGKNIAVVPGSAGHYLLVKMLDSKAKATSEVNIIPLPLMGDLFRNFISGSFIDAAMLSEPYLSEAVSAGKKTLVVTERNFTIEEIICAGDFAMKNRQDDIQIFVNSYFNLIHLIKTNPGLAKSLITKQSGKSIKDVEILFNTVDLKDLTDARTIPEENIVNQMKKVQQIWGIEGLPNASGKVVFEELIDSRYLENAKVNTGLFEDSPPPDIMISPSPETSPEPAPPIILTPEPSPEEPEASSSPVEISPSPKEISPIPEEASPTSTD